MVTIYLLVNAKLFLDDDAIDVDALQVLLFSQNERHCR